jgi:DNA-binding response OmpR family regulator
VLLLERILQAGGYSNLAITTDPRKVLEFFTAYRPDLILLDLMMPHVDGFALITQLRSRIPEGTYLPIMVLTADVTPKAKQQALSLGAKDFLTKPFDATEVLLRVYNLLETRWLSVQLQAHIKALENPSP